MIKEKETLVLVKRGGLATVIPHDQPDIIEAWMEPVYSPEGELLFSVHKDYLPKLIAILRATQEKLK